MLQDRDALLQATAVTFKFDYFHDIKAMTGILECLEDASWQAQHFPKT